MALRRVVYNVTRNPELSAGGALVHAPVIPVQGEAREVHEDGSAEFTPGGFPPGDEVDEADAAEQAREVRLPDDDYR